MNGGGPAAETTAPRPLMIGKGWFPAELGGLDRYFRGLFDQLPEARAVVIGAGAEVPDRVRAVSGRERSTLERVLRAWSAAQELAGEVDLIDAHFAIYSLAPLFVGRLRRKPAVLHFHGPWADEVVLTGDGSAVRRRIRRLLERSVYHRASEAVVLSSTFRQLLVERYGVSPWRISVVPPGVELARFGPGSAADARRRFGVEDSEFVAAAVRRLVPRMGLDVLIEAWSGALTGLPAGSVLLIAGDGAEREALGRSIRERGLERSVRMLGRIDDEALADLYRAADVNVVPTLAVEGFGLVVIEAAACGTPSIVTAVGGLPEAVAGLDRSLIVPPGDVGALRRRLISATEQLPSRDATRAYAKQFDWPAVATRHRAIMRRAVGTSRRSDRIKVVYVGHTAKLSGGEIALLRLVPHLHRVDPHVILAEDGPLVGELNLAGISVEVMPMWDGARKLRKEEIRGGGISPRAAASAAAYVVRLAHRLRRLQPDLVHTNTLKAGVYGSVAGRLAGIPVVWHVRDRIADDYLPQPAVRLVRAMTRHLATAVVANSRSTMQTLSAPSNPLVIYSVLPEVMSDVPARQRSSAGPLTYGIVGRVAPWKGQDLFLRAFAKAFPAGEERAVVIGSALFGEDDYESELPELARRLGVDHRVEFRGYRSDVWAELARLDVLVHASITPEPFGQVILEGMAAGVPVIAAGAGGPAEILKHGHTGLLYPQGDANALADAMSRLRDPELRARLRDGARHGLSRYSPQVVAAELLELYVTVAQRARRRR